METTALLIAASAGLSAWAGLARSRRAVVQSHEAGLLFRDGRFVGQLAPGAYRLWRRGTELRVHDLREQLYEVPGQEVPSRDGVSIRCSLALRLRIADALLLETSVLSWHMSLHTAAQLALRDGVSSTGLDELLENRTLLDAGLQATLEPQLAAFGVELIEARVRDIAVSAELRQAFAAHAKAAAEARANLERTRGETAALRALANAARLVEQSPGMAQIQLLQTARAAAEGAGNQLVLKLDGSPPSTDE